MKTKARVECVVQKVESIPDGTYFGHWGGHVVKIYTDNGHYEAKTEEGIRTPAAAVDVTVTNGEIEIELRPPTKGG